MHSLLQRQLKKLGLSEDTCPDAATWKQLLHRLTLTYEESDEDRYTLERSLMISSREMQEMYANRARLDANFKVLVESSPDAIFVRNGDVICYANQRMASLLGYGSASDLLGVSCASFVHSADAALLCAYRDRLDAGRADGEALGIRWTKRTGESIVIDGVGTPIVFDGAPAWLGIARDVTEARKVERERDEATAALRSSEERYRALFDGAPLPVMLYDTETLELLAVNEAGLRLYGYEREEFLKLRLVDLKAEKNDPELDDYLRQRKAATSPRNFWSGTKAHRKKDGTSVELEITAHDVTIDGRRAMLALSFDVTERRRLEAQLRQSQKMEAVGQLAGGIAHDFNNILAVVLAETEYVKEELAADSPLQAQLDEVTAAAERAAALTHQLLAFSRRQILKPRVLALNVVVSDLDRMLRRVIGEDISLEMKLNPALGAVMADPGQVEQVIMNLVVNARDALLGHGSITVHTDNLDALHDDPERPIDLPPGSYVTLTVSDSGCGMDKETLGRIFEPFFTTKEVGRGTGLGLSTVLGIVQQSGGVIHVESRPGEGSRFRIFLPRVDQRAASASNRVAKTDHLRGVEQVLLVEDDPHVRRAATRALERRGYRVVQAENGEEALERFGERKTEIDLVVTDLVMPGIDGVAVASRLRQQHGPIRILYMSGYTEHAVLRDGALAARAQFLQKPFSANELAVAVRTALDAGIPTEVGAY